MIMLQSLEQWCVAILVGYSISGWIVLTDIKLVNYGRFLCSISKIHAPARISWLMLGIPNWLLFIYFLLYKRLSLSLPYGLFLVHYIHRDIIYPLTMKSTTSMPIEIICYSIMCKFASAYLQGIANQQWVGITLLQGTIGLILFVAGMWINVRSDGILQQTKQKLLKEGQVSYCRIDSFLFKWVTNPNYLGEIIEWIGYAVLAGHLNAWLLVIGSINALVPAAIARNRWNKQNIKNYPENRHAIVPFIL